MSIQDSGADVLIELRNRYARTIFENAFRSILICPPLTFQNLPNPANPNQMLSADGLVPRLKDSKLRQVVQGIIPHVFVDLTLEPSVGTMRINGQSVQEITLPVEVKVSVGQGAVTVGPDLALVSTLTKKPLPPQASVTLPLDLLNSSGFSLTPVDAALKLVGTDQNLALALDVDLAGTITQFSGDCPKAAKTLAGTNLNGAQADLSKFRQTYNDSMAKAFEMAIVLDKDVLAAKIMTVKIDQAGLLEGTRLWLISVGPQAMLVGVQGCWHHQTVVGDWWDGGAKANVKFLVKGSNLIMSYEVQDVYLTDTDSEFDTCVSDKMEKLKQAGMDKGEKDLGIPTIFGKSSEPTGTLYVHSVEHRAADAVLTISSNLIPLGDPWIDAPYEILFAAHASDTATFDLGHRYSSEAPIHVCSLKIENDTAKVFSILDPTTPFTIPLGTTKTVKVRCTGEVGQNYTADLSVIGNAGPCIIALKALLEEPSLEYTPILDLSGMSHYDYCSGQMFDVTSKNLKLENTGKGVLVIYSFEVTVDKDGAFAASCGEEWPIFLKPGESIEIHVSFAPKTVDTWLMAQLVISTNLGLNYVVLKGYLTHIDDFVESSDNVKAWANASRKNVLCGKLRYKPPLKKPIPADLVARYVDLLEFVHTCENQKLFLELALTHAPRDLAVQILDRAGQPLAHLNSRFNTKTLFVPYEDGALVKFLLTSTSEGPEAEMRFVLRNWCYNVRGVLKWPTPIRDFTIARRNIFVADGTALHVAEVTENGSVRSRIRFDALGDTVGLAMVGNRLVLAGACLRIVNASLPEELVQMHEMRLDEPLRGVQSPDPRLHYVHPALLRMGVATKLAYPFGWQLHVVRVRPDAPPKVLSSHDLPEPARRGFLWGRHLYLVGAHSLTRLDPSDPTAPTPAGVFRTEREITNGYAFGCMVILVHQGPSATLVDVTRREELHEVGEYAAWPSLQPLFPALGPVYMDSRFLYSLAGDGSALHVGEITRLSINAQRLQQWRATSVSVREQSPMGSGGVAPASQGD